MGLFPAGTNIFGSRVRRVLCIIKFHLFYFPFKGARSKHFELGHDPKREEMFIGREKKKIEEDSTDIYFPIEGKFDDKFRWVSYRFYYL